MSDKKGTERKVLYQLMNYKRNQFMLSALPHIRYLDMAIVFSYQEEGCDDPERRFLVTEPIRGKWGLSVQELEDLAAYHTPRLLPVSFQSVSGMINAVAEHLPFAEQVGKPQIPMSVLTNQRKLYGAAVILYPRVLWAVSQTFQDDLYIIPSSIHECLILPSSAPYSLQQLETMVQSINHTQIPLSEVLSEHVYVYRRKANLIGF